MKIKNIANYLNYFSLILVLSFFILHNILLVLIGIIVALYDLNKNLFNINSKLDKDINHNMNKIEIESIKQSAEKDIKSYAGDSKLSLVETIEEIGFIPSIDKHSRK